MRPIHFPESNREFSKPSDMTDEQCSSISAYVGESNGFPYINTVWMPNKEDIDAINAGRPIILSITSNGMPPVSLFTCDEEGTPNE
jgi:hypothetical protein